MKPAIDEKIFKASLLSKMSSLDFEYARNQLRQIYSKDMAKVLAHMFRRKLVNDNYEQSMKKQTEKLKKKQNSINQRLRKAEQIRKRDRQEQSKIRRIKQIKWIQRKQKAQQISEEQDKQFVKQQKLLDKKQQQFWQKRVQKSRSVGHTQFPTSFQKVPDFKSTINDLFNTPRKIKSNSHQKRSIHNQSIIQHNIKKLKLLEQKQQLNLQNYLQRIQLIEKKRFQRKSRNSMKQRRPSEFKVAHQRTRQFRHRSYNKPFNDSQRNYKLDETLMNKQQLQQIQFNQRTKLLKQLQREALHCQIVKQIKAKIKQQKIITQR